MSPGISSKHRVAAERRASRFPGRRWNETPALTAALATPLSHFCASVSPSDGQRQTSPRRAGRVTRVSAYDTLRAASVRNAAPSRLSGNRGGGGSVCREAAARTRAGRRRHTRPPPASHARPGCSLARRKRESWPCFFSSALEPTAPGCPDVQFSILHFPFAHARDRAWEASRASSLNIFHYLGQRYFLFILETSSKLL